MTKPTALSVLLPCLLLAATGCRPTGHAVAPSALGVPRPASALEAVMDQPGPVSVETVVGADWKITRAGLINLDHPKAKEAHLTDGDEPIQVVFHALRHPTAGLYLVDSGVERALREDPGHAVVNGLVASVAKVNTMQLRVDTRTWLEQQPTPPAGVFLTHLHLDHVMGLRDVPDTTPVYSGPGETSERALVNLFVAPTMNRALSGKGPLLTWRFEPDPDQVFAGVLDLFGDGSVWALSVPGHTPGSTAYLARTPSGPVLMVGDASHTAWGWENGVEPGTFSEDKPRSAESLARLKALVARHPAVDVRLGHQALPRRVAGK